MTETTQEGAAFATPAAPAAKDHASSGAQRVDPLEAVENAALREQRIDSSFLDSLEPDRRKAAEKYVEAQKSKAVNDALKSKTDKGEYLTHDQVEDKMRRMLAEERERSDKRVAAREKFYNNLATNGVLPGTEDYAAFTAEAQTGAYNQEAFDRPDVIERIVRAAGVGKFRKSAEVGGSGSPYLGTGGVPLKAIADQAAGKTSTGNKLLDDARELLTKMKPTAS
jgi:hypothetical protein